MKPSESHKQPTFVIPKNPFQEVGSAGATCIVCVMCEIHSSTRLHPLCWTTVQSELLSK